MSNHNRSSSTKAAERVTIVVFGDLARSPRMLNHCISLCELPTIKRVDLVGYAESELISEVANNDKVHLHVMNAVFPSASTAAVAAPASTSTSFLKFVQRFFLLRALYKIIVQTWTLFYLLMFCVASPDVILMQVCCCRSQDTATQSITRFCDDVSESSVDSRTIDRLVHLSAEKSKDVRRLAQLRLHAARNRTRRQTCQRRQEVVENATYRRARSHLRR
jgi:hypothetical protein